ncbi:MAG: hypothetical protein COT71_02100 [Candidatus Andersenbacteria bacterium CG10_big_fil_rev_8_21_14_0_10_54_11]|uniref:Glycosyltransferase family 1 protein n=1 Tax=Candidatus Andersenbacteria bacterium CG10_big_fil_rev_8_21_14_0_10_54_11 TaxID=1974485 RepID=A0A2M6WZK0_9BACT|nr:MAG: hypothetical protein COT71_02100 [Candidatus Andersenbacteria bacterium CG10_big_fil_rev_8_21_14_0_10_54_11]
MNIAVDVRPLMEGRHSGVEEYTIQVVRALLQDGRQHRFRLFYNSFRPVQLPTFPGAEMLGYRYPNKAFNIAQLLAGRPRWDHLVAADVFFLPHVRLLPVSSGVPYVVTVHDLSFARFPFFYSRRRRVWHQLVRPRQVIRQAAQVIAVSEATRDDLVSLYGVDADRVSVVHSGIAAPAGGGISEILARRLPERFVLYLGTLEPRKNIAGLITAYSAIADRVPQDLVLAGSRGWLTGGIDRAYGQSSVQHRIHFLGFVPEADKTALYARADLFVYPSFYEGFGFPPLEALAAGTPAVVSHNSSLPEVAGEWAYLVNPYDTTELAAVLQEALLLVQAVPAEVQTAVRRRYDWQQTAAQTLTIIERAAGGG